MDTDINVKNIDWAHWIAAKTQNKRQYIIVKSAKYSNRRMVFSKVKRFHKITNGWTNNNERWIWVSKCLGIHWKMLYKAEDTPNSKPAVYHQ